MCTYPEIYINCVLNFSPNIFRFFTIFSTVIETDAEFSRTILIALRLSHPTSDMCCSCNTGIEEGQRVSNWIAEGLLEGAAL